MIVDISFAVDAVARKHRARNATQCLLIVERPFVVKEKAAEEIPLSAKCPRQGRDMLFRSHVSWHVADGKFWTPQDVDPEDHLKTSMLEFSVDLHSKFFRIETDRLRLERLSTDNVVEIHSSNEDEIVAALQRRLDRDYIVSGGRLFVRSVPPVLTSEMLDKSPGFWNIPDLPVCMWDLDADMLKRMYPGRSETSLRKAVPKILRPDLLEFDRDKTITRKVAAHLMQAFRSTQKISVRNPLSKFSKLDRLMVSDAPTDEIVSGLKKAFDYGIKLGIQDMPVNSILRIVDRYRKNPTVTVHERKEPTSGRSCKVRIDLKEFGASGTFVDVDIPVAETCDHPVVAVFRSNRQITDEPVVIRGAGDCLLVPMVRPVNTYGAMKADGILDRPGDMYGMGDAIFASQAVSSVMRWHSAKKPSGDVDGISSAVAAFASRNFVSIDGIAHARSGEPLFAVENSRIDLVGSLPEREDCNLRVMTDKLADNLLDLDKSNRRSIPVSLLDGHALLAASNVSHDWSAGRKPPEVEILDRSRLSLRTEHLVAATAASYVLSRIAPTILPPSLSKTVSAASDAVRDAFEGPSDDARRSRIMNDLRSFADLVATDRRLSGLRSDMAMRSLTALLMPELGEIDLESSDDAGPVYTPDPEDGSAYDFSM